MSSPSGPPTPPRRPLTHTEHGVVREDPWAWLREVGTDEVRAHLAAERAWYESATAHLDSLVSDLHAEMVARTPEREVSARWTRGGFSYYTQVPAGRDHLQLLRDLHPSATRIPSSPGPETEETVLLDLNVEGAGSAYVELGVCAVSPDERWLAWSLDLLGDEVYRMRFRDLETGRDSDEEVPRSYYGSAWSADSRHLFYTVHDEAYRAHQVRRHVLGTPVADDVVVLEEPDERFELQVRGTRSGGLVVLWAESRDTSEVWVVPADDPTAPPRSVGGRRPGVVYHAEHQRDPDRLLVVTDDDAVEFRLASAPVPRAADQDHTAWSPLRAEEPDARLERVEAFAGHLVLRVRTEGERRLRVLPSDAPDGPFLELAPRYAAGTVDLGRNEEYDATAVVVADQSYVHPVVWSEVDLATGERRDVHAQEAPGHDASAYVCERLAFAAPDGTPVGATVVRRAEVPLDGTAPALLYGYGAYEYTFEPDWDPALPSLLDRGVVFVHAHVRGGGEGGRRWWLQGRLEHKPNTFDDHAAVADGLAAAGLVDGGRLATRGLSAGGLLQGAVLSRRPDRWRAVVAEVPFVDVVTTMLDPSIPLTVNEWDEWGDPRRRDDFDRMLAWSPYDNPPPAGGRPDLLATGALHDPRVMVWEPAKWVLRLRESDPEWAPRCLFRVETGAGAHAGPAGRYAHLRYEAEVQAWVLDRLSVLG